MEALMCYACEPRSKDTVARRRVCMLRGEHKPTGEALVHRCSRQPMKVCGSCETLVVEV